MEYQTTVKAVIAAVSNELTGVNKWQAAGQAVREFYGSEAALTEVKAQFIADAIMPAMDKKYIAALAVDLPRKGSKEYNILNSANQEKWEAANQAKKDARAVAHTMFNRVLSYAFPKDKSESVPKTLETRLIDAINDCIGKIEKAEEPEFDAVKAIAHLKAALTVIAK